MNTSYLITISGEDLESLIRKVILEVVNEAQKANTNQQDNLPNIMRINEAAEYLRMAKNSLYTLTNLRKVPFIKRGGRLYFRKEDLDKWLLEGKKEVL